MDVTAALRRFALSRPQLFVIEGPGGTEGRLAVEAWSRTHGWPLALAPVDADVVVLCGEMTGGMTAVARASLGRVPAPCAVVVLDSDGPPPDGAAGLHSLAASGHAGDAARVLEAAREHLLDWPAQRAEASPAVRTASPDVPGEPDRHGADDDGDHAAEHGGHGDMHAEHGDGMDVAGLAMADRAEDRDGLKLDVLHVPLGPVLPAWPAGLRLSLILQGDLVADAAVDMQPFVGCSATSAWWPAPWRDQLAGAPVTVAAAESRRAAAHLDSLGRLLAVTGADGAARTTRRLRDAVLAGRDLASVHDGVDGLRRRLERSRLLARATEGLGALDPATATEAGVSGPALRATGVADDARTRSPAYADFEPATTAGADARARWRQWLAEVDQALALAAVGERALASADGVHEGPRGRVALDTPPPSRGLLAVVADLVRGVELAGARVVVASLDPDVQELTVAAASPAASRS